jgi:L-ribulose-5-phosphate 3-epimerase
VGFGTAQIVCCLTNEIFFTEAELDLTPSWSIVTLLPWVSRIADKSEDCMKRQHSTRFGCNTYSYTLSHTAEECLIHLAELGFSEFELMMVPGHLWPPEIDGAQRKALRRRIAKLGARVVALNMPNVDLNIAGLAPEMRRYTLERLISIIELAGDLGVPGIVVGPGKANPLFPAPKERLVGYFLQAMDKLQPLAEKAGTALWVENLPFAFLPKMDALMEVLEHHGNPEIGVVWDAANSHFAHEDPAPSLKRCRERLKLVHLSDTNRWQYRHDAVGLGTVPFAGLPAVLSDVGYRDSMIIEVISHVPDSDILDSVQRLTGMGFGKGQVHNRRSRTSKAGK